MDRKQKETVVAALQRTFGEVNLVVVAHQTRLTVAESTQLRRQIRAAGAAFKVSKNRLTRLALEGTKFQALQPLMTGPTVLATSVDPVAAAKVCVEFAKKNEKLTIVGGALDTRILDEDGIRALARLPSLDELRGGLIGLLQTPATRVARVLREPAGQLARVFGAYGSQDEAA